MCGIVGYIGKDKCIPVIMHGLKSLEYRGYDSAGIAYKKQNKIIIEKEQGKITYLERELNYDEESFLGIGHTRWATHGKPSKGNSHPHRVGKITLVHNGIIENYKEIKNQLTNYEFISETDTEVLTALIDKLYKEEENILKVLNKLKKLVKGSYAICILVDGDNSLYAIRHESPLLIGKCDNGYIIASDVPAFLEYTNKYYLLENDEYIKIENDNITFYSNNKEISKEINIYEGSQSSAMKNGYEHFMLKEINEQPKVIKDTLKDYIDDFEFMSNKFKLIENAEEIDIVGCGSAYHVAAIGKHLIEKYGKKRVNIDIASEYRYTDHFYNKNHLIILISQSGETADTLAVLRNAKEKGIKTLAIVNVIGSTIAREANEVLYIKAGPEIAVATTKAYSCQLVLLSLIACFLGIKNKILNEENLKEYKKIEKYLNKILEDTKDTQEIAKLIKDHKDVFYLGRKIDYALCLEASLKLKEISYIHSEAYAAGELKHGTISLIEEGTPVISIITDSSIKSKTISNIKEVCSRGALSIIITNTKIEDEEIYNKLITLPNTTDLISSLLVIIKCQLISYYVAKYNGCDIDKPRNLAKSVTVE